MGGTMPLRGRARFYIKILQIWIYLVDTTGGNLLRRIYHGWRFLCLEWYFYLKTHTTGGTFTIWRSFTDQHDFTVISLTKNFISTACTTFNKSCPNRLLLQTMTHTKSKMKLLLHQRTLLSFPLVNCSPFLRSALAAGDARIVRQSSWMRDVSFATWASTVPEEAWQLSDSFWMTSGHKLRNQNTCTPLNNTGLTTMFIRGFHAFAGKYFS
jgi:hypothetical protein